MVGTKADWKLFCSKLPEWQEAYMDRLTQEYIGILSSDRDASTRFWTLEKRIKQDRKRVGVRCELDPSELLYLLLSLLREGAITTDDLDGFSDPLKEIIFRHIENTARLEEINEE